MSEPMITRPEHVPLAAIRTVAVLVSIACVAGMVGALIVPTFLPDGWRATGFTLAGMVVGLLAYPLAVHLRAPSFAAKKFHADNLACDWLEQLAEFQVGRTDTTPDIRALFERGGVTRGHAHDVLRSLDRMRGEHYMDVYGTPCPTGRASRPRRPAGQGVPDDAGSPVRGTFHRRHGRQHQQADRRDCAVRPVRRANDSGSISASRAFVFA